VSAVVVAEAETIILPSLTVMMWALFDRWTLASQMI